MFGVNNISSLFIIVLTIVLVIIIEYISIVNGFSYLTTNNNESEHNKLYRVLRADEDPKVGLIAKDRFANKSVLSHVNCGSRKNYQSQYISTTTSLDVAQEWVDKTYKDSGAKPRIGVIYVNHIPYGTEIIDLTIAASRDEYLGKAVCKNFANKSQEVLLANMWQAIPFHVLGTKRDDNGGLENISNIIDILSSLSF